MPRKTFTAGEVLAAADVNTFLMDQSVMTFADSAARGSAIGTATEGMVTYLEDTDGLELWNGTAWTGVGGGGATNAIINGAFEINQRGFSSSTVSSAFGFDRWFAFNSGGTATQSAQTFTPGTAPLTNYEGSNFLRLATSGQSAAEDRMVVFHNIEDVRTFANQTATLSFYAKAASGTPKIAAELNQVYGTAGSASENNFVGQATLSTSWQRFSFSFALPSLSGKTITSNSRLQVGLWTSAGSDWDSRTNSLGIQNAEIDIWGVQVEAGSTATPFRRNANSIQGELAACQRYYFRSTPGSAYGYYGLGVASSSTNMRLGAVFPVQMRTRPTSVDFSNLAVELNAISSVTIDQSSPIAASLNCATTGLTIADAYRVLNNNNTSGFLGFSAEL
jgi:hypothetical protein